MRAERHEAIEAIAPEWDALADRTGAPAFARPGWHSAWWRAFGAGSLEVIAVRDGDELSGVLPVVRRAGGVHLPANWHSPQFAPAGSPQGIDAAYDALFATRPPYVWARLLDPAQPLIDAAARCGYVSSTRVLQRGPYLALDEDVQLSKRRAARLRRLSKLGVVDVDVQDGSHDLQKYLHLAFALEASGWKSARGTAISSTPATLGFYTELAEWAAARGMLRLFFLRLDGRAIASEFVLLDHGRTYSLKGGYDPEFRKFSPGLILSDLLIGWGKENGCRSHEFLGDIENWKLEWTELSRPRYEVVAVRGRVRGRAVRAALTYGRPASRAAQHLARRIAARARHA